MTAFKGERSRFTFRVPTDLHEKIKLLSDDLNMKQNDVIIMLLNEAMERHTLPVDSLNFDIEDARPFMESATRGWFECRGGSKPK